MLRSEKSLSLFCSRLLYAVLIASSAALPLQSQDAASIKNEFRHPAKQYRPMARWWWPGGNVTDKEIAREIGLLDAAGFGGAEIQPFVTFDTRTLPREEAEKVTDFATPSFYQHVRAAVDAAKARGMWIDDTFGTGWPFGGGLAITPELSAIELRTADTVVDGPKSFSGKVSVPHWQPGLIASMMLHVGVKQDWPSGWEERLNARSKVVAVVAIRSAPEAVAKAGVRQPEMLDRSSAVILTDRMKPDGTLDWQVPDGTWHIFVSRQIPTRQPVIGAAGTGPQLVLDHFNKAAFAAHAARVGDPLVQRTGTGVGSSLRAIFCDSLELQQYVFWSDDFLAQFKKRRGYDLTPYLAILRQPGYNDFYFSHPGGLPLYDISDGGDAIRADYWKTISELIYEGFYHPFDVWARQHNILARVQAHGAPADILKLYGDASIPETEELDGGNTVNFMKLASSAGYDYGRRLVSSESFVFHGNPYITTPESIKANSDRMFVSGVNQIVYHGFPYDYDDGTKGTGWFPFQGQFSSHINEHNPIWPHIGKVNEYITRLQYIMQQGKSELQVAIFRSALNEEDTGPTPASGLVTSPFPAIGDSLTAAGYSFGFVTEDVLLSSKAKSSVLTTKGGGQYTALIVPHETNVSTDLVKAIGAFAAVKLPVIFIGGMPEENVSFKTMQQDREAIAAGLRELSKASNSIQAANNVDGISRLLAIVPPQLRFTSGAAMPFVKKSIGAERFYMLSNPTSNTSSTTVEFTEAASPELWDAWTGNVEPVASTLKEGHIRLDVSLPPFGSELIAFGALRKSATALVILTEMKRQNVGEAGWTVDAKGNSEKGIGIAEHVTMAKLTDWLDVPTLHTFSGRAAYVTNISVSADDLKSANRVLLDLGEVKDAAEVKINGVVAAALIVHPFTTDVRSLLHGGDNKIEVTVVNSLTNYVSTIQWPKNPVNPMAHFPPTSAGLLGPVFLEYQTLSKRELPHGRELQ